MSIQNVFNDNNLKEYIFSFIYSLDYIIKNDLVHILAIHETNSKFMEFIDDETVNLAAEYESINILKWLIYNRKLKGTEYAIDIAANTGNFEILNLLRIECNEGCSHEALLYAAENGDIDTINWLLINYADYLIEESYFYAMRSSIEEEYYEILKYLYYKYRERYNKSIRCIPQSILNMAIIHGNLDIIIWITDRCASYCYKETFKAAKYEHMDVLQWLYDVRIPEAFNLSLTINSNFFNNQDKTIIYAAETGNLEIVKYLCKKELQIDINIVQEAVNVAAKKGFINIIKYLYQLYRYNIFNKLTITYAAEGGYLNIIKFIYKTGSKHLFSKKPYNRNAMDYAAKGGNLHIIKWLHEQNLGNCTSNLYYNACKNGHLNVVKWVTEHKYSIYCNERAMDLAATGGYIDLVTWLCYNRCEGCSLKAITGASMNGYLPTLEFVHNNYDIIGSTDAMDYAAMNGQLHIIKWLHENRKEGCTKDAMNLAANNGHLDVVKWLHINRSEGCTTAAMDNAARSGHLDLVRWLHKNRTEGCTKAAVDAAAINGHISIMQFLLKNRKEGFNKSTILMAFKKGHISAAKYLQNNIIKTD